mmetsp:Transcript_43119/g.101065  ORF Transcript_43119/g.101065 Transcript_43119/m.101065 type:complete len:174 (-) Transcript_43119:51-572(-)
MHRQPQQQALALFSVNCQLIEAHARQLAVEISAGAALPVQQWAKRLPSDCPVIACGRSGIPPNRPAQAAVQTASMFFMVTRHCTFVMPNKRAKLCCIITKEGVVLVSLGKGIFEMRESVVKDTALARRNILRKEVNVAQPSEPGGLAWRGGRRHCGHWRQIQCLCIQCLCGIL